MARANTDALFKKNSKLESFLKRTLPEEAFERVRGYESCIIVTEKENKGFKYCVLDDENVYVAENPPKNPTDLQVMVPLKDIIAVELVNDFPDFLSGEERTNTQHIQLNHWTCENLKKRSFRKSKKSPRTTSLSDLHGDRSNASTPLENISLQEGSNISEDYGYVTQSTSSLQINSSRPDSRGSIGSNQGLKIGGREIKTSKKKKREGMEDSVLKALKEEMEEGHQENEEELEGLLSSSYISEMPSGRNIKGREVLEQRKAVERGGRRGSTDTTVSQTGVLGMQSMSDFGSSFNGINSALLPEEKKKTVLNIYLLNLQSPMLMLIRSAWNNYLIKHTLNIDLEYEKAHRSSVIRSGPAQREKMEVLFNALKRDLLNPENTMEDTFSLLTELKTATEKNFTLKKLFWKNADMFLFLVRQTQRYLPKSPVNVNTEHGRIQRCDELELVILLTEILSLMFRESEIIPARIQTLKADRGKAVFDLIRLLICSPEVPEKLAAPSKSTQNLQATDEEIHKQTEDFKKAALLALFEIFLMARQANWGHREASFFNISWVIKTMEEMKMTENFVENVVSQMMRFIGPARTESLMPQEAVSLYVQFSVLQTFLHYSPKISGFIRNHYFEEFKYFVQVPAVMKKLPQSYPICMITMTLIESVTNKVLDQSLATSFSKSPR